MSPHKQAGIIAGNLQWATPRLLNWHQSGGYCTMKVCQLCHPQLQTLHNYCGLKGILFNFWPREFVLPCSYEPPSLIFIIESNGKRHSLFCHIFVILSLGFQVWFWLFIGTCWCPPQSNRCDLTPGSRGTCPLQLCCRFYFYVIFKNPDFFLEREACWKI